MACSRKYTHLSAGYEYMFFMQTDHLKLNSLLSTGCWSSMVEDLSLGPGSGLATARLWGLIGHYLPTVSSPCLSFFISKIKGKGKERLGDFSSAPKTLKFWGSPMSGRCLRLFLRASPCVARCSSFLFERHFYDRASSILKQPRTSCLIRCSFGGRGPLFH